VAEPAVALVEASKEASCLVVGARGRGGLAGTLLGTTSLDVASHADCPVVVVRELPGPAATPPRVVVGADGSGGSADAIGYAFAQAAERLVPLTVVHVATRDVDRTRSVLRLAVPDLLALSQREQAIAAKEIGLPEGQRPVGPRKRRDRRHHPGAASGRTAPVLGDRGAGIHPDQCQLARGYGQTRPRARARVAQMPNERVNSLDRAIIRLAPCLAPSSQGP
jgi:nucleotide-binding universal stress UspA family protein